MSDATSNRPSSVPADRLTVEEQLKAILQDLGPLQAYDQPLVESLGLTLRENITSSIEVPRFDTAEIDGYAVRSDDLVDARLGTPVEVPVVAEIIAGSAKPFAISAGTAVKIMAGAPLPRGADAIVGFDKTDRGNARVRISHQPSPGEHVIGRADDVAEGTVVLEDGAVLGPREIGLIAALGHSRIKARPRPRIVILSAGQELREPGAHLAHDSVFDANSSMIAAAVRSVGAISYRVGVVDDSPKAFKRVLSDQLVRADLVITTGGINEGARDSIRATLSEIGDMTFSRVAITPGGDIGHGTVFDERTPIIALPREPVSAYVNFEVFALPAIRRMMGRLPYRRPNVHAVLAADIESPAGVRDYVRAVFEVTHRGAKVTPLPARGPHAVASLAAANALIIVGEDETALNLGDTVRTIVLDRDF